MNTLLIVMTFLAGGGILAALSLFLQNGILRHELKTRSRDISRLLKQVDKLTDVDDEDDDDGDPELRPLVPTDGDEWKKN